jgi:lysozyme
VSKFILDTRLDEDHFVLCTEAIRRDIIEPEDLNEGRRTMAEQQHFFNNQPPLAAKPHRDAPHIWEGRNNHALDVNSHNGAAKRLANFYESQGVDVVFNVPGEDWHFQPTSGSQLAAAADKILKQRDAAILKPGEREKRVKFLKHQLHWTKGTDGKVYYRAGKPRPKDGYDTFFNDDLKASVKRFQKEHNLEPDGVVGPATDKKIDTVYATQKRRRTSAKKRAEDRKKKHVQDGVPSKVSKEFIEFLASWEGERLEAYQVKGEDFWTIGVGHARTIDGKPIKKGQKISKAKSRELLKKDLERFEKAVIKHVPLRWRDTREQFETCVSLAFNMGEEILTPSPPLTTFAQILHKEKDVAGRKRLAGDAILLYNKGGSPLRVMPGLVRRRAAERTLWLTGKYVLNN